MQKNVAGQTIGLTILATNGTVFAGTVLCYVAGDNGTQTLGTVSSGVCTYKGNGEHVYRPSQAETNYDRIKFSFIGSGAIAASAEVYPRARNVPVSQVPVPALRTWRLIRSDTGLVGARTLYMRVGRPRYSPWTSPATWQLTGGLRTSTASR